MSQTLIIPLSKQVFFAVKTLKYIQLFCLYPFKTDKLIDCDTEVHITKDKNFVSLLCDVLALNQTVILTLLVVCNQGFGDGLTNS